jgi:hypothetical protein
MDDVLYLRTGEPVTIVRTKDGYYKASVIAHNDYGIGPKFTSTQLSYEEAFSCIQSFVDDIRAGRFRTGYPD